MSDKALIVEGLGKRYRIGEFQKYKTMRDTLTEGIYAPMRAARGLFKRRRNGEDESPESRHVWAIKDISFELKQGEVVGVIGRNGAGKSTLLKVLSRITEPTEGQAEIRGKVGSLLEVGTGFHYELSGRENIYLSGAILGMRKSKIDRQFDEIVDFAEVERFLDTPVKHYSSGMYVRLAFAVAAFLEPEVLLVDEVLAVGDYEFQKKCLGKMGDVSREGRTVLIVSHSMSTVMNLCERVILLEGGKLIMDGPASDVVGHYISTGSETSGEVVWPDPATAPGNETVRLHAVRILSRDGEPTADVSIEDDVVVEILFWNLKEGAKLYSAIHLKDQMGNWVLTSANMPSANLTPDAWWNQPHPTGLFKSTCRIPGNFLNDITYTVNVYVGTNVSHTEAMSENVLSFRVYDTGAMRKEYGGSWNGPRVRPRLAWSVDHLSPEIDRIFERKTAKGN